MLRRYHIARLAFQHSPEKEQRLLHVQGDPNTQNNSDNAEAKPSASSQFPAGVELSVRQKFHDAIFDAIQPGTQKAVLHEYLPMIQEKIGTVDVKNDSREYLDEVMQLTRMSVIDEMNREESDRRELGNALNIDTSDTSADALQAILEQHRLLIERYVTFPKNVPAHQVINLLQALLHKDIERIRKTTHEKKTGIKWQHLHAEDFLKIYHSLRGSPRPGENVRIPNAFSHEKTMYFNVDHTDYSDPVMGEMMANRAVSHEAVHLALSQSEKGYDMQKWVNTLRSHSRWKDLSAAVESIFRTDPEYLVQGGKKNERIVGEALAIFVTNDRHPTGGDSDSEERQKVVHDILADMFANPHTGYLLILRKHLEATVDRYLELDKRTDEPNAPTTVGKLLHNSAQDSHYQHALESKVTGDTIVNNGGVETNADEGVAEAGQHLAEKTDKVTPDQILSGVQEARRKLDQMESRYPEMKNVISKKSDIDARERGELLAAVDQNLEYMSQQRNDLRLIEKYTDALKRWDLPVSEGGLTAAEKSDLAESAQFPSNPYKNPDISMEEADRQTKGNRELMLTIMQETLAGYEKTFQSMEKALGSANEGNADETPDLSPLQWLKKNIFSSQGNIAWISPKNIVNIIKIYKDAIVQNYASNQKVKENRFAKNLNFYKPIQHTLNKLARSANNTESSEFLEYIQREGFTYDDVFGADGTGNHTGLLNDNRHNFNRAKAVLEYAADHGWLYKLNKLEGSDVYGIDFEGIEGKQSFEELVQRFEAGKKKQENEGYERVDKDADVPPIINTLLHELHQKNIFAVQGIMKRLQEKAKFSHSNTWMLTSLLMSMRDHPELRVCFDKGMIDNISNFTISQAAWSVTWLKIFRDDMMNWKEGKDPEFANNPATKVMEQIEKRLANEGVIFPDTAGPEGVQGRKDKYEAIAIIMAGKTYKMGTHRVQGKYAPRRPISIFENEFNDYRRTFLDWTANKSISPKDTDDDYWDPGNGGSDVLLLGTGTTYKIVQKESQGKFENKAQADGYFTQMIDRYEELKDLGMSEALENFRREMHDKLIPWMETTITGNTNAINSIKNDRDIKGRKILEELTNRGIIDQKYKDFVDKNAKSI